MWPKHIVWLLVVVLAVTGIDTRSLPTIPAAEPGKLAMRVPTPGDGPRLMDVRRRYRSPMEVAVSPDGRKLYVSDFTFGTIVVLNAADGKRLDEITLEGQPAGLVLSADGKLLFVADYGLHQVLAVDLASRKVVGRTQVGRRPFGIAVAPQTKRVYVCNLYSNDVSVIDAQTMKELGRIPVVREPRFVAVTADESKAIVCNSLPIGPTTAADVAMDVSLLDLMTNEAVATVRLPVGASNGRGVAVSPDGKYGYAVHMRAMFNAPVTQIERGWELTGGVSVIDLEKGEHVVTAVLDDVIEGAPNPYAAALSPDGTRLYVGLAGTAQVMVVDIAEFMANMPDKPENLKRHLGQLSRYGLARRIRFEGSGPRGAAVSPDGKTLYVANYYSGTVVAVDASSGKTIFSAPVGPQPLPRAVRRGEMYYNDAKFGFERWASCASCHPEGRADGLNWDLINDGIGNPKETKSHLYATKTPPVMARAVRPTAEVAIRAGFKWIQFAQAGEDRVADILAYMQSLRPEPSPYLTGTGKLTESARRGQKLFEGKARCAGCHSPPLYTDLESYDVGTLDPKFNNPDGVFDTPTLVEIWRTGPYLHDGRAVTLREVFTTYNVDDQHGITSNLTDEELEDLFAYLLSL